MTDSDRTGTLKVWDLPLRLFHWLLVLTVFLAFLSSESGSPIAAWHMAAGWCAAVLLAFRLVWGFVGGEHARFPRFVRPSAILSHVNDMLTERSERSIGHNPLGGIAVLALLGLTGIVLWSGISVAGGRMDEDLHEAYAYCLLALIGLHIFAVVLMSFLTRENLVRAMISGRKKASLHPSARDARRPGIIALLLGAAAIILTVVAVLRYDPSAFGPQLRDETHEQHGDRE